MCFSLRKKVSQVLVVRMMMGDFASSKYEVVGTTVGSPAHPHHARPSTTHQHKNLGRIYEQSFDKCCGVTCVEMCLFREARRSSGPDQWSRYSHHVTV